jgi:peptidoglycan biosynthesis protein MviN/MurJ (putative lipid II flippase)
MAEWKAGWEAQKGIARVILRDRGERRKILFRLLLTALLMLPAGLWLIDGWLEASVWRFAIWWAGCGLLTVVVVLFALYDALAVIGEERAKMKGREEE